MSTTTTTTTSTVPVLTKTGLDQPSDACSQYVSLEGDDTATGTKMAPWRSVAASVKKIAAGAVLCLRDGTYSENVSVTVPKGTSAGRIVLQSYPGERATIHGNSSLIGPDYWTIRNLNFTMPGSTLPILKVLGGTGWILEGNDIFDGAYAGLLVGRSSTDGAPHSYTIRYNAMHDTAASNFYHNPSRGSTNGLIERNLFFNSNTQNEKLGWGGTDICTGSNYEMFGIGEVTFRHNTLYNANQPLAVAESGGELKVDVYANLIVKSTGRMLARIDNAEGCLKENVWVHNNGGADGTRFAEDFGDAPQIMAQMTGNVMGADPLFDSLSITGFRPADTVLSGYGRYAGQ